MTRQAIRPEVELLWLSTVDQGRQLELSTRFGGLGHTIATVVADEKDESLWVELEVGDSLVQVPIDAFRQLLESALGEVRSETWFQRNVEGATDPGLSPAGRAFLKRRSRSEDE